MSWLRSLTTLDLIDVFNVYLLLAFAVGTLIRIRNYQSMLGFIVKFSGRYPKLLELMKKHRTIFLTWPTLLPIGCTLGLMLANTFASYFVWTHARVTPADLWERWLALLAALVSGTCMLYLDGRAVLRAGRFNRLALEKDLDKAEHWLQSWKSPAIRVMTLGFLNPRKIVNDQVRDALIKASLVVNGQMWRWSLQIAMRVVFALTLWLTWALALRGT